MKRIKLHHVASTFCIIGMLVSLLMITLLITEDIGQDLTESTQNNLFGACIILTLAYGLIGIFINSFK